MFLRKAEFRIFKIILYFLDFIIFELKQTFSLYVFESTLNRIQRAHCTTQRLNVDSDSVVGAQKILKGQILQGCPLSHSAVTYLVEATVLPTKNKVEQTILPHSPIQGFLCSTKFLLWKGQQNLWPWTVKTESKSNSMPPKQNYPRLSEMSQRKMKTVHQY